MQSFLLEEMRSQAAITLLSAQEVYDTLHAPDARDLVHGVPVKKLTEKLDDIRHAEASTRIASYAVESLLDYQPAKTECDDQEKPNEREDRSI